MKTDCRRMLVAMILAGAGLARAQEVPADAAAAMAQAMAALGQAAEKNAAAGAVDAKDLRALLPEKDVPFVSPATRSGSGWFRFFWRTGEKNFPAKSKGSCQTISGMNRLPYKPGETGKLGRSGRCAMA